MSKKKIQKNAEECIDGILNDIGASEKTKMAIGFVVWTSINDAYALGYKNATKRLSEVKK